MAISNRAEHLHARRFGRGERMDEETDGKPVAAAYPAPLIPCDVDLRDFRFMPLDVVQLQNSETWGMADGWTAKALLNLWTKAWHQVPSGSLPDNDDLLRTWANVPSWESVRDVALRGFIKCSDGRLYHRIICRKALDAWNERKRFRRAAKARWKHKKTNNATHMQGTHDAHATHDQQPHATHMQGTGTGTGIKRKNAAGAAPDVRNEEADLFHRGKAVLGDNAGGLIKNLIKAKGGSIALARAAIETASTKQDPREYIAACTHGPEAGARSNGWDPGI
jgi:uncharacterized protein YdaU (DUF1376 family)